jgi:LuxR family transcriptional regulator, regulator of acetate metabolism
VTALIDGNHPGWASKQPPTSAVTRRYNEACRLGIV